jgi:hypothetical protein
VLNLQEDSTEMGEDGQESNGVGREINKLDLEVLEDV